MDSRTRQVRHKALFVAFLILATALMTASPVSASPLTSVTAGATNPFTGTANAQYNWNFTTATTATLTRATMGVPVGTSCNARYLAMPNTSGNYAWAPDSPANSVTGDIDLRMKMALADWTPSGSQLLMAKRNSKYSFQFFVIAGGKLDFAWSADGTSSSSNSSSAIVPAADGTTIWVRVTFAANNGSGGNTMIFYTSNDGIAWNQLGSTVVNAGVTSIYDSLDALEMGSNFAGTNTMNGKIYYAEMRNGINGTVVSTFDPSLAPAAAASSWTSATTELWTVNRNGTNLPADIACDLTVSAISGLPAGGIASVRLIDRLAVYSFAATSVNSGTVSTLNLTGFTNTSTPGTYTSTVTTYNATPTSVDSATASGFSFFTPASKYVTNASVSLSDSTPAASNVRYTFTASSVSLSSIACMKVNFGTAADQTGGAPGGMSLTSAALDVGSTWTESASSWSLAQDSTSATLTLTYGAGAVPLSSGGRSVVFNGMGNPTLAGTYFAVVSTYSNSNCITGATDVTTIAFAVVNGVTVSAIVDPTLTFGISNRNTACNGEPNFVGTAGAPSAVTLGRLAPLSAVSGGQSISVISNAAYGFTVSIKGKQPANNLRNLTHSWDDGGGPYGAPDVLGSGERFAYTYKDSTAGSSIANPASATFVTLTDTANPVMASTTSSSGAGCVSFTAQASSTTPAGTYTATVIYTAVPNF